MNELVPQNVEKLTAAESGHHFRWQEDVRSIPARRAGRTQLFGYDQLAATHIHLSAKSVEHETQFRRGQLAALPEGLKS
ncbi:MAG TPA: hypothetical protein VMO80_07635 [Terriglobales bacterium]|nr:hypothetical protein [Terriglobales bacterium]